MSILCFTGPRPKKLYGYNPQNKEYDKIQKYVEGTVLDFVKKGVDTFVSGGAQGFDMIAFSAVDAVKSSHPELSIKNILYLPCLNQGEMWILDGLFGRNQLEQMKEKADTVVYVHNRPYMKPSDMTDRNHAMVDISDEVIALYPDDESWKEESGGTAECMRYAAKMGKPITRISLEEIMEKNKISLFGITKGIICQQVNCQDVYGAGLSGAIMEQFPEVSEKYHDAFVGKTKEELFGKIQMIEIAPGLYVANIFSQFDYGNSARTGIVYTDAGKLVTAVEKICNRYEDFPVYLPHSTDGQKESGIGCGLAGENWGKLSGMFQALNKENLHLLDTYTGKVHEFENKSVPVKLVLDPAKEGVTHLNIFSRANTELGQWMSNFAHTPIDTKDGHFESVEGYWHYLGFSKDTYGIEKLRDLHGSEAASYAKSLGKKNVIDPDFGEKIADAIHIKFTSAQGFAMMRKYKDMLTLPITHYYTYGDKNNPQIVDVTNKYPEFMNPVKKEIAEFLKKEANIDLPYSKPKYPFCKGMSATGYKMEQFQSDLAEKYGYKPLPMDVKNWVISEYLINLPECFAGEQRRVGDGIEIAGRRQSLYLKGGVKLADGYDRIVVGHYGAFLEISKEDIDSPKLHIKPGEEYRLSPQYKDNVKYIWLEPIPELEDSGAKIYHQQKRVGYADYLPGKFYISPYEVMDKEELGKMGLSWIEESSFQDKEQIPQIKLDIPSDFYEDRAVIFDTETTGTRNNDELLSIAIVNTDGEILLDTYVKPDRLISWPDAQKVNHISPKMVEKAPNAASLHDAVKEIFEKASVIVGHNVPFDLRFVKNCIGVEVKKDKTFDTCAYFKKDEPSLPHKLGDAVDYYCPEKKDLYNAGAHSAITDTIVTAHVYNAIMEKERNYDR